MVAARSWSWAVIEARREGVSSGWGWPLAVALMSAFAAAPLLLPGYHWGAQDARHSVYFLLEFDRAIRDGVLYPRWAPDFTFGYGYPFFNIYGPLSCYLGEAFHLLGLGLVDAVKAVFILGLVVGGLGAYAWLRLHVRQSAAFVGALLYVYAPYHLVDMYVRASLAEVVALAMAPFCFLGFGKLLAGPAVEGPCRRRWVAAAGASYALLILSSNVIALLFTPVLAGYCLALWFAGRNRSRRFWCQVADLGWPAFAAMLGLGLSAIFWLPALLEYRFVRMDQWIGGYYEYRNHFVSPFQLLWLRWGYGISQPGPDDGMSFQLGAAPWLLGLAGLLVGQRAGRPGRVLLLYFAGVTLVVAFLTVQASAPIWAALGLVRFAQFPWRLLVVAILSLAFLGAHALSEESGSLGALLVGVLVIIAVRPYLHAELVPTEPEMESLRGLMRFQQSADEMTGATIWVKEVPRWSPLADQIMSGIEITTKVDYVAAYSTGRLGIHSLAMGTTYEKVWFQAEDDEQRIRFLTFYYPGWRAFILDEESEAVVAEVPVEPEGELGLISVRVPRGRHILLLAFTDTPVRRAGAALTWASAAIWLGLMVAPLGRGRK
jgi:hypothetical protein